MAQPSKGAFISHSSADAGAAFEMCTLLEARGLSCWIAPRDVQPGQDYAAEIVRGIESAGSMVLLVSSHSNASSHVLREVEQAIRLGKPIFPILIEQVQLSKALNYYIAPLHWIVATAGPIEGTAGTLASAIRKEPDWKRMAMAPSLGRTLRYRRGAYLTAFTGSLISMIRGLAAVYLVWSGHTRSLEARKNSSYLSLGWVALEGETPALNGGSNGAVDVRAAVYLSVPDIHFSEVAVRIRGADIAGHPDGDVTGEFNSAAVSPQVVVFRATHLQPSIVTCLSLPRSGGGPRFRVTQRFHPQQFESGVEFDRTEPGIVTPEDGRPCGAP
jgi:hypothetical protein